MAAREEKRIFDIAEKFSGKKVDFHIHSTFSDGKNTPEEIIHCAIALGLQAVCITDHIRMDSSWLEKFSSEMRSLKKSLSSKIGIFSAFETKVIDFEGSLDMPERIYGYADFIYGAIHRLPLAQGDLKDPKENKAHWIAAFQGLLKNPMVDVVAHPMAFLRAKRLRLSPQQQEFVIGRMVSSRKVFEINLKYRVPGEALIRRLKKHGIRFMVGSDSHSVDELKELWSDKNEKENQFN